jgi:hypothetical protein
MRQHQARARVETEAFEAALLVQVQTPVQIALAKTAASFYLAVRLYHWRRMARAKQRPKELAEAVAAGNALDRMLETLGLIPNPGNADSRTTAHRERFESASLADAPPDTPAAPKQSPERVFTEAEFMALPQEEQRAWLRKPRGTYEIVDNEGTRP